MKKMRKVTVVLALAVVLIAAGAVAASANVPIPGLPDIDPSVCERQFGFGILQRLFPAFDALIHRVTCR